MSLAAVLSGYVVSLGLVAAGLALGPESNGVTNINFQLLPLALKFLLRPFLGAPSESGQADPFADPINLAFPANPILIGGVLGLIVTALISLPAGRLDGGVLSRGSFGRAAGGLGFFALGLLLAGGLGPGDAGALYLSFGLYFVLFQNGDDLPPKDGVTEVDDGTKTIGAVLSILAVLLVIPGWWLP